MWARLRFLVHGEAKTGACEMVYNGHSVADNVSVPFSLSSATSRLVQPGEGSSFKASAVAVTGLSWIRFVHFPHITSSYYSSSMRYF